MTDRTRSATMLSVLKRHPQDSCTIARGKCFHFSKNNWFKIRHYEYSHKIKYDYSIAQIVELWSKYKKFIIKSTTICCRRGWESNLGSWKHAIESYRHFQLHCKCFNYNFYKIGSWKYPSCKTIGRILSSVEVKSKLQHFCCSRVIVQS